MRAAGVRYHLQVSECGSIMTARPLSEWHEDDGAVLWWNFPISEPPYAGTPLDSSWPYSADDEWALGWTHLEVPTGIRTADGTHDRRFVSFPARYPVTRDEMVKMAGEHGCTKLDPFNCVLCGQIWSS
jgi:hypothetical protein